MGLCCQKSKADGNESIAPLEKVELPADAPKLIDIEIFDVNTLLEDRWQYQTHEGKKEYKDFDKMDRMVLTACNQHLEELMAQGITDLDPWVPLSQGRIVNLNTYTYHMHNKPKVNLPIRIFMTEEKKSLEETVGFLGEKMIGD